MVPSRLTTHGMHCDPDVEDDNLLLCMVHGIHDPIVSHADPVEMLLPPLNLRTPNGRGVSDKASILWRMRGFEAWRLLGLLSFR